MPDGRDEPTAAELEFRSHISAILKTLASDPLAAIGVYDAALTTVSPVVAARLRDRFGPSIEVLIAARDIDSGSWSRFLSIYTTARRADQGRMLAAVIARLIALGGEADGGAEPDVLRNLGRAFEALVLEGTAEQRFCCRLGIRLAGAPAVPSSVHRWIVDPLVPALITILRIGAPRTAMLAVEATGALLTLVPDPLAYFPAYQFPAGDFEDVDRGIALAIGGDMASRESYFAQIERPLEDVIADLPEEQVEAAILQRVQLLRMLPAVIRQTDEGPR